MVIRVVHFDKAGENILRLQLGSDRFERRWDACQSERARAIECRDAHGFVMAGNDFQCFFFREANSKHGAFSTSAPMHHAGTQDDDPCAFFEAENSCDACGCNFADTVADNGARLDTERFPKCNERELHREDGWLSNFGLLDFRIRFVAGEFF